MTIKKFSKVLFAVSLVTFGLAGAAEACPQHQIRAMFAPPAALAGSAQAQNGNVQNAQGKHHKKAHRKAKHLAKFDANQNGKLDPAEREAMKKHRFTKLDANRDGSITLLEMQAARKEHMARRAQARKDKGQQPRDVKKHGRFGKRGNFNEKMNARFARHDVDNNGSITWQEFNAPRSTRR